METTLNKETIKKIETQLLERKKQIQADLDDLSRADSHEADNTSTKFPEYGDKPDENAQEISDYSTNVVAEKVLEKTLEDINKALERMQDGTYGVCKYCNGPIGEKRMLARPTAGACIACKTKLQENG